MSRLTSSVLALTAVGALCATAVGAGASQSSSPVLAAPAATAAQAGAEARAALRTVTLPAGSQALSAKPGALSGPQGGPDLTRPYVTFKTASAYWRLAGGAAARALLAQFHHTAISETGPGEVHFVQVTLPVQGAWMGPRWLTIETAPGAGGHWLAELQGVAVWTPSRLELPGDVAAVTVTSLRDGSVLARVSAAAQVGEIVDLVNALAVDDAIHAVYACPELETGMRPGFELSFAAASGAALATATSVFCPPDVALKVGTHGPQALILGDLVAQLQRILGITLPSVS